ncbi:MAG: hypothetical protein ABSE99_08225 [Terracidiphilus sp.]|jgi:hypothetical protein
MARLHSIRTGWLRAGLALAGVWLCVLPAAWAQSAAVALDQSLAGLERSAPDRVPDKPSQPPAFTIDVAPLGFSPPGPIYLGQQNSLASLDFLDEDHLLFTFRVPGLIRREAEDTSWSVERQIRAVVLALPSGTAQAEALWTVHDRVRYLWMLKGGHFLLRDRDGLQQGDATLELKPFLHFPGPLLWLGLDPAQQFLLTESREPAGLASKPGEVSSQAAAQADATADGQKSGSQADVVVRILRRDSGQVMLVTRIRSTFNLPIGADGYLEALRGNGQRWVVNLNYFGGGSKVLGRVDSVCSPSLDFVSKAEVLVSACDPSGGREMVALAMDGRRLWRYWSSDAAVWPLVVRSMDGSRVARETLAVTHPINAYSLLGTEDVRGQVAEVFDAADGRVALEAPVSPVLDAGGNVALSPSGRRVAVLNGGAIQVFELPAPPPLAAAAASQPAH